MSVKSKNTKTVNHIIYTTIQINKNYVSTYEQNNKSDRVLGRWATFVLFFMLFSNFHIFLLPVYFWVQLCEVQDSSPDCGFRRALNLILTGNAVNWPLAEAKWMLKKQGGTLRAYCLQPSGMTPNTNQHGIKDTSTTRLVYMVCLLPGLELREPQGRTDGRWLSAVPMVLRWLDWRVRPRCGYSMATHMVLSHRPLLSFLPLP